MSLLHLERDLRWVADDRGRLLRARTDDAPRPAPLLAVGTGGGAVAWAVAASVADDVAASVDEALAAEPPVDDAGPIGWAPSVADRLQALLDGTVHHGPTYLARDTPPIPAGLDLRTSADTDLADLAPLLPPADRILTPPWVAVVVDGEVAAVCESARARPDAVHAGLWTYPDHRRQGLATAVTAAWIRLAGERTVLYGTTAENHASQGVARRLGLRPLAQWWWLERA
ncbi:MAG TPA: GNAT family N-acetyltransferase [Iamia sp.]